MASRAVKKKSRSRLPKTNSFSQRQEERERNGSGDSGDGHLGSHRGKKRTSSGSKTGSPTKHQSDPLTNASSPASHTSAQPQRYSNPNGRLNEQELCHKNWSFDNLPSLVDILQSAELCDTFAHFLEESYCQETLLFYLAAEDYENIEDPLKRKQAFMEIINRFLVDGAEYEMDFSDERRRELLACMDDPSPTSFVNLRWDVFTVMSRDCVPKFQNSRRFKDYLDNQPDSPRTRFSRLKLQDFFGEEISGPLQRCEIIDRLRKTVDRSYKKSNWKKQQFGKNKLGYAGGGAGDQALRERASSNSN